MTGHSVKFDFLRSLFYFYSSTRHSDLPYSGAVAQLGERLNGIQEVVGSIPIGSTNFKNLSAIEKFP